MVSKDVHQGNRVGVASDPLVFPPLEPGHGPPLADPNEAAGLCLGNRPFERHGLGIVQDVVKPFFGQVRKPRIDVVPLTELGSAALACKVRISKMHDPLLRDRNGNRGLVFWFLRVKVRLDPLETLALHEDLTGVTAVLTLYLKIKWDTLLCSHKSVCFFLSTDCEKNSMHSVVTKNRAIVHYKYFVQSLRKVSKIYGIGKSTLSRWLAERGVKKRVKRVHKVDDRMTKLVERHLSLNPFLTSDELRHIVHSELSKSVSRSSCWRYIRKSGFSYKRARAKVSKPTVQAQTIDFKEKMKDISLEKTVSLDETYFYISDKPRYGYSKRGEPLHSTSNRAFRAMKLSLLMAISSERVIGFSIFTGNCDTARFVQFLQTLDIRTGEFLVMDNVAFHKSKRVLDTLTAKGVSPLFIPPYSPQYNPIEMAFSQIKCSFRKMFVERTEALYQSQIEQCIRSLAPDFLKSIFQHVFDSV
jgi:transposase